MHVRIFYDTFIYSLDTKTYLRLHKTAKYYVLSMPFPFHDEFM